MAGSGNLGHKKTMNKGFKGKPGIEYGYGTPSHSAPQGTVYVKLDASMGTSSHYRNTDGSTTWAAMSDD